MVKHGKITAKAHSSRVYLTVDLSPCMLPGHRKAQGNNTHGVIRYVTPFSLRKHNWLTTFHIRWQSKRACAI